MAIADAIFGGLFYALFVIAVYVLYLIPAIVLMAGVWFIARYFAKWRVARIAFVFASVVLCSPSLELGGLMVLVAPNWLTLSRAARDNTWLWYEQHWLWYLGAAVITGFLADKFYSKSLSASYLDKSEAA